MIRLESPVRSRRRLRLLLPCAAVAVVAASVAAGIGRLSSDGTTEDASRSHANAVVSNDGGVRNIAFYYGGGPLAGSDEETLERMLGRPSIVVTTRPADEAGTIEAIHSVGARAYRYVQFYWAPGTREYDGVDLSANPDWAFCRKGSTPSLGRRTAGGSEPWYFLDTNEREVRAHYRQMMGTLLAAGWDGVFVDRGQAATQYGADVRGRPVWARQSTCTSDPHDGDARFADAFVNLMGVAEGSGLDVMVNNGTAPLDPVVQMRPDPADRDCRRHEWSRCPTLSDAWRKSDLVLSETATRPKVVLWKRTFEANGRSERHPTYGRRTVVLITTSSLGGLAHQNRRDVFYAWSRVKLFDLAVGVNTGDDGCVESRDKDSVCNRHGLYPDLVNISFGEPRGRGPESRGCVGRSHIRCVWTRMYADGVNVLNASARHRSGVRIELGRLTCRYVYDVLKRAPLAGNRCVAQVRIPMGKWTGRPLLLSEDPW